MMRLILTFAMVAFVVCILTISIEGQTVLPGIYYPIPSWDQQLPASTRFVVLSNWAREAVLDRETGLVWERSPSARDLHVSWFLAHEYCSSLTVGNRMGWRLPTLQELTSLIDPSVTTFPTLPGGHPFENVQPTYWSATTHAQFDTWARVVSLMGINVVSNGDKSGNGYVWCVRGGSGTDAQ